MTLLEETRSKLRLTSTVFDESEIAPLIEACKMDLAISGVVVVDESDPLIKQAVSLFCKGSFGFSADAERFMRAYEALKQSLALCSEYNGG